MKVFLISTPYYTVPPKTWGGIESQVHYLAKGFHELGHEVTLVARPGSKSPGSLIETFDERVVDAEIEHFKGYAKFLLDWDGMVIDHTNTHMAHKIYPETFNVIHWYCYPLRGWKNLISISATLADWLRQHTSETVYTIHNSIDPDEFEYRSGGDYYLFFSKIDRSKGADVALDLARAVDKPFHFAGITGDMSEEVKESGLPNVTFHGEVSVEKRRDLFRDAECLIFPTGGYDTDWIEAFGVVMLEAMSSGTPVLAYRNGAVPEVVIHGKTGFICDTFAEMKHYLSKIKEVDPQDCRKHVEEHFTHLEAAEKYLKIYRSLK